MHGEKTDHVEKIVVYRIDALQGIAARERRTMRACETTDFTGRAL